jgi:N-acetylmuramoyl-L-alanine amidase
MRKIIVLFLIVAGCLIFSGTSYAQTLYLVYDGSTHVYEGNVVSLKLNGELLQPDVPPIIMDDRTLVPVRAIFEKMGAEVNWDGANRKVQIATDYTTIELRENDKLVDPLSRLQVNQ